MHSHTHTILCLTFLFDFSIAYAELKPNKTWDNFIFDVVEIFEWTTRNQIEFLLKELNYTVPKVRKLLTILEMLSKKQFHFCKKLKNCISHEKNNNLLMACDVSSLLISNNYRKWRCISQSWKVCSQHCNREHAIERRLFSIQ